jgi:hypothetical protein
MAYKALFCSFFVSFCTFCASLRLKNPFNQRNPVNWSLSAVALAKADAFVAKTLCACPPRRLAGNPWLINDLRAYKALYNCRETFTDVMDSLQISSFYAKQSQFPG